MSFRLAGVTVDCSDPRLLADFWAALLGRPVTVPLPGWLRVGERGDGRPVLTFQPVPEPKQAKVRIHLDLEVDDIDDAIGTVRDLGGTETGERHDYDEGVVVVLADPEGNEFCVVRYFG